MGILSDRKSTKWKRKNRLRHIADTGKSRETPQPLDGLARTRCIFLLKYCVQSGPEKDPALTKEGEPTCSGRPPALRCTSEPAATRRKHLSSNTNENWGLPRRLETITCMQLEGLLSVCPCSLCWSEMDVLPLDVGFERNH